MKAFLAGFVVTGVVVAVILLAAAQCPAKASQAQVTANGSACSQAGCAYTRHHRETLCSEDHAHDRHEYRAQGILRSGEQVTVRDGSGVNEGVGCTNPRGGGRFQQIRGGWPGHWTSWRPA